jgi:hypothetical protein
MKNIVLAVLFALVIGFGAKAQTYTLTDDDVVVEDGIIKSCSYSFELTDIIIPQTLDGQTVIGIGGINNTNGAFKSKGITSIVLPSSIQSLGYESFYNNSITNLDLSGFTNLKRIGNSAFQSNKINTLNLTNCTSLDTVDYEAFHQNSLDAVFFNNCSTLQYIGDRSFYSNTIDSLNFTGCNSLKVIGNDAFISNKLSWVDLTPCTSLMKIEGRAFAFNGTTSLILPMVSGFEQFGWKNGMSVTFSGGDVITGPFDTYYWVPVPYTLTDDDVVVEDGLIKSCSYSFELTDIIIPQILDGQTVTEIGSSVFYNKRLTSVKLPATLKVIGSRAFSTNRLVELDLTNFSLLESIGERAFYYNKIATLTLTGCTSLATIGVEAFYSNLLTGVNITGCRSLLSIGNRAFNSFSGGFDLPEVTYMGVKYKTWKDGTGNSYIAGIDKATDFSKSYQFYILVQKEEEICEGGTFIFGSQNLITAGEYTEIFHTAEGIDSTVVLTLTVNTVYNHSYMASVCEGETYEFGTQSLTIAGEYVEVFESVQGCDSTVTLTLTVFPTFEHTDEVSICEGTTYNFGTQSIMQAGEYTEVFESVNGCDSIVTLLLTVLPTFTCPDSQDVNLNSLCQLIVPDLVAGLSSINNCNVSNFSQLPLAGTAIPSSHNQEHTVIISAEDENGNSSTCVVILTGKDVTPPVITICPSIVTVENTPGKCYAQFNTSNLSNFPPLGDLAFEDNCGDVRIFSYMITWNWVDQYNPLISRLYVGDHDITVKVKDLAGNIAQCSYVIRVIDTELPVVQCKDISVELDDNGQVSILANDVDNGSDDNCNFTLDISPNAFSCSDIGENIVTLTITDASGNYSSCEAIVTVEDAITPTYTDAVSICIGDTYSFGSQTLTTSGEYEETFSSISGCDSVVTLTLTVNPVYDVTDEAEICDGDSYTFGTQTLTISGEYEETFSSISGCDSVVTLTLTVNPVYDVTDEAEICDGDSYTFGTQTLTTSGEYEETFSSISGCDSVVTLTLAVRNCNALPIDYYINQIEQNADTCFNAENEVIVAFNKEVVLLDGSYTQIIAGSSIKFFPGFHAQLGSKLNAYITTDGSFCDWVTDQSIVHIVPDEKSFFDIEIGDDSKNQFKETASLKAFPNPTSGLLYFSDLPQEQLLHVAVYDLTGKRVAEKILHGENTFIDLSKSINGIYFIRFGEATIGGIKILKQ